MGKFENKIALITGAPSGIGRAIALSFLEQGATVIGVYGGNINAAKVFEEESAELPGNLFLFQCNVANKQSVKELFQKIEDQFDYIDILVNNAGVRRDSILALMKDEDWDSVIDINLTGTFSMSKEAVMLMMKNKFGRIINITSPASHIGFAGQTNYSASKAGQIGFTRSLAKEVAKKKITVNCVSPGFIATNFINDLPKAQLDEYKKLVPMKRFGKPEEVANTVLFLASDEASYISGATIEVSGGL
ncbi:MAG: 3-oxoacyl-[acyl-carrier-protein] reductase [Desulfotalea sp.]